MLALEWLEGDVVFKTVADSATLAEAEQVIDALAALHGHFWQDPRFATTLGWLQGASMERAEVVGQPLRQYAFDKVFRDYAQLFPPEVRQARALLRDVVQAVNSHNQTRAETLQHGDPHLGNMYFQDGEVGLLDWQVAQRGCCMKDIAYFMMISMLPELRQTHQRRLVERYVACLRRHGVAEYALGEAWYDYRINSIHPFIAAVITAASGAMQDEAVVERALINASSALVDLGAIGLFRHLNAASVTR